MELGPLPTLKADPLQVRQLFQNLIGNGSEFHYPDKSPLACVTARAVEGPEALTGIRFEEIDLDRIFQVFQRPHGHRDYEGTGMGPAI